MGLALLAIVIAASAVRVLAQDSPAPPEAPPAAPEVAAPSTPPTETPASATATPPPAPPREPPREPAREAAPATLPSLSDLPGWLDYKMRHHIAALPLEARLFHRRGVLQRESGNAAEAARMVRGASELDPSYMSPHLSLAEWSLLSEPSQALLRYATVLDLARQNFLLQLSLIANALYAVVQALFLGLLVTAILLVAVHHEEIRHPWSELLARHIRPAGARLWSWGFLVIPYAVGFGLALPTLFFLGQLWSHLRARERFIAISLAVSMLSIPLLTATLDHLTLPLDDSRAPLYGVALVETEPASRERTARLHELAEQQRGNGFLQFAAAWVAGRGGDLATAEDLYRRALALWPQDDRTLNNLGNVMWMRGHADRALELYVQATTINPANAAAWFNQSQIHTQRFDYRAATDALTRASALDFEMVKHYQSQGTDDGALPLVEQWIAPRRFWDVLARAPLHMESRGALPPSWRHLLEARGWGFSLAALLILGLGFALGLQLQRGLPLRVCGNCGRVVCRRCAERRRELALCPVCVDAEKRAESADFGRILLVRVRRRRENVRHLVRTSFAALIPGFGLLALRRAFSPLVILTATLWLLGPLFAAVPPFAFEPRLALSPPGLPWQAQAGAWIVIYAWSLVGYFRALARQREKAAAQSAPVRSRAVQTTHTTAAAA